MRAGALLALVMTAFVGLAPLLAAQEPGQPPAAQDGFVPVKPGELEQEQLPAAPLVFAAYSVVWLALLAYVFLLWRRLTAVERDLREVSTRLQAKRP
jgi:CcmD family protein